MHKAASICNAGGGRGITVLALVCRFVDVAARTRIKIMLRYKISHIVNVFEGLSVVLDVLHRPSQVSELSICSLYFLCKPL